MTDILDSSLERKDGPFITPYPQDALGGKTGLLTTDIARSLGVSANYVRAQLCDYRFAESKICMGYSVKPIGLETIGLQEYEDFALCTQGSKLLIALSDTVLAEAYLEFLDRLDSSSDAHVINVEDDPIVQQLHQAITLRIQELKIAGQKEKVNVEQDNLPLTEQQIAEIEDAMDRRIAELGLPPEARALLEAELARKFLPQLGGEEDLF